MDGNRFDSLTRTLAQGMTRRRALKGLAGVLAAAVVGGRDATEGSAQAACPAGQYHDGRRCICQNSGEPPNRKTGECRCGSGKTDCGGVCVTINSDPSNCGGCGVVCPGGECRKGQCRCAVATCESLGAGCGSFADGCGGTVQCTACPAGQTCDGVECTTDTGGGCTVGTECASGVCVGGVCCDQACDGPCVSCATGRCAPVSGAPCGGDGVCGGTCQDGTCGYPGAETVCGDPVCSGGTGATSSACDGRGACVETTTDCGLFHCRDGACIPTCESSDDCLGAAFCNAGVCQGDLPNDAACATNDQCQSGHCLSGVCRPSVGGSCAGSADCPSGFCVDGICCDRACEGGCESCDSGVCSTVSASLGNCAGDGDCEGSCDGVSPDCTYPGSDTVCGAAECPAESTAVTYACDGAGACPGTTVECGLYLCAAGECPYSCADSNQCVEDAQCVSGVCQVPGQGETCSSDDQCPSGKCVSGVCKLAAGRTCGAHDECFSGACLDGRCMGGCELCVSGLCNPRPPGDGICSGGNSGFCWGYCDGVSSDCIYPGAETVCGAFECPPGNTAVSYACDGAGFCLRDTVQCTDDQYCEDAVCLDAGGNGATCSFDGQCRGGHCIAGICCQQDCQNPGLGTATCLDGVTCGVNCSHSAWNVRECGGTCCLGSHVCCPSLDGDSSVCCRQGADCINGVCTEFCRERGETCDPTFGDLDCCLDDEWITCDDDSTGRGAVCVSRVGGPCQATTGIDNSAGCGNDSLVFPDSRLQIFCAPVGSAGEGICGGAGALCLADGTCTSRSCCGVGVTFCCDDGERCVGGTVCQRII